MTKKHPNIGSSLDDLLKEKGILEEVNAAALKRVISLQIEDEMRRRKISKSDLAKRMHTSRMAVDRLLDTTNGSVTLNTLGRVASALGRRLSVELV